MKTYLIAFLGQCTGSLGSVAPWSSALLISSAQLPLTTLQLLCDPFSSLNPHTSAHDQTTELKTSTSPCTMSSNSSQHTAMASSSQTPVDDIGPHNTATQAPSGLQKAPMELRLRIYKLLIVPRGSIGVDEAPRAGTSPWLITL